MKAMRAKRFTTILTTFLDIGVLKGAPQSVTELSPEKYMQIKEMAGIDERFTVS